MLSQSIGVLVVNRVMTFNPPICHFNVFHSSPSRGMISSAFWKMLSLWWLSDAQLYWLHEFFWYGAIYRLNEELQPFPHSSHQWCYSSLLTLLSISLGKLISKQLFLNFTLPEDVYSILRPKEGSACSTSCLFFAWNSKWSCHFSSQTLFLSKHHS